MSARDECRIEGRQFFSLAVVGWSRLISLTMSHPPKGGGPSYGLEFVLDEAVIQRRIILPLVFTEDDGLVVISGLSDHVVEFIK